MGCKKRAARRGEDNDLPERSGPEKDQMGEQCRDPELQSGPSPDTVGRDSVEPKHERSEASHASISLEAGQTKQIEILR